MIVHHLDEAVGGKGGPLKQGARVIRTEAIHRLVPDAKQLQLVSAVADVACLNHRVLVQLLLDIQQPLQHVRSAAIDVVGQCKRRSLARAGPVGASPSLKFPGVAEVRVGPLGIGRKLRAPADVARQIEAGFGRGSSGRDLDCRPGPYIFKSRLSLIPTVPSPARPSDPRASWRSSRAFRWGSCIPSPSRCRAPCRSSRRGRPSRPHGW